MKDNILIFCNLFIVFLFLLVLNQYKFMIRILIIIILYVFVPYLVESQPINMVERELRYHPDSLMNRYNRGELDLSNQIKERKLNNEIMDLDNSKLSDIRDYEVESEVHAAINPIDSNNIIISPIFQNDDPKNPQLFCSIYYTTNAGLSWKLSNYRTNPIGYKNVMILGGGDPVLTYNYKGRAYLTWLSLFQTTNGIVHTGLLWAYSDDGGRNWIEPEEPYIAHFENTTNINLLKMADKQWVTVNKNNDIFVSYTYLEGNNGGQTTAIYVAKLPSGKNKFESPVKVSNQLSTFTQFSTITVDERQDLHVMHLELFRSNEMLLVHSKSTDSGKSFNLDSYVSNLTMPQSILDQSGTKDTIVGITTRRLYPAPLIVADNRPTSKYKNNLYAVWNANGISRNVGKKMDIYFSRSTDGGKQWEKAKILNRENNSRAVSQYYPSLAVNKNGVISISYYDRNDDVNFDIHTDYVIQFSYDGGLSFTEPRKINTIPTDFRDVGINNGLFGIGEYNMLIFQDEQAIPVWADGREGDGKVRIYTTRTNQDTNGIEVLYSLESTNRITNAYFENLSVLIIEKLFTKESSYHYELYDLEGNLKFETDVADADKGMSTDRIDIDHLATGVYFVRLKTNNGYSVAKFIKN